MNETKVARIFSSHVLFLGPRTTKRVCVFSHRKYLEMVGKFWWFLKILQTRIFIHGYDWLDVYHLCHLAASVSTQVLDLKTCQNCLGFKSKVSICIYNMHCLNLCTCPDQVMCGNSPSHGGWVCLASLTLTIWQYSITSSLFHWKIIREGQGRRRKTVDKVAFHKERPDQEPALLITYCLIQMKNRNTKEILEFSYTNFR